MLEPFFDIRRGKKLGQGEGCREHFIYLFVVTDKPRLHILVQKKKKSLLRKYLMLFFLQVNFKLIRKLFILMYVHN